MDTKTLSPEALAVIDGYLNFRIGAASCSVPYYNNKTLRSRSALNALVGKGTRKEISDEAETLVFKSRIKPDALTGEALKKLLADQNIGIDCSGLAYHVLDAEGKAQGRGALKKRLAFLHADGLKGFIASKMHPARLTDVATLADDRNSRPVELHEIAAGDMITMMTSIDGGERNHILIIHKIGFDGAVPKKISYTHAVAYPEDGLYGSGVKQGEIEVNRPGEALLDQRWIEGGKEGAENRIFRRAQSSRTEIRRLKWL